MTRVDLTRRIEALREEVERRQKEVDAAAPDQREAPLAALIAAQHAAWTLEQVEAAHAQLDHYRALHAAAVQALAKLSKREKPDSGAIALARKLVEIRESDVKNSLQRLADVEATNLA